MLKTKKIVRVDKVEAKILFDGQSLAAKGFEY